ncbi:MAG TPA: hypothetical protein VKZ86_07430 [Cyclobacteriaceae bacterium]|nr:hypothetical protein [Cyclobacteriaceae bacterium]
MKYFLTSILVLATVLLAYPQDSAGTVPVGFADSVRIALEKTRNAQALAVAPAFGNAWGSLSPDQQDMVQRHVAAMRSRKYSLNPYIINYLGAVANAVNEERASPATLTQYLTVAGQVIEAYEPRQANRFFEVSRTFFAHHALHYENAYRLYARDDQYQFEFIVPETFADIPPQQEDMWDDSAQEYTDDYDDYSSDETWNDEPVSDLWTEPTDSWEDPVAADENNGMPSWYIPPPPPFVEGPVISFEPLTLNFVTRSDSVFLRNTKGDFAIMQGIFVGNQGRFDWTPAGLSADSVYCEFEDYNFNVSKPAFTAEMARLTYLGRTPGAIQGSFSFRSESRPDSVWSTWPRFRSYQSNLDIQGFGDETVKYRGGFSLTGRAISSQSVSGDLSTIEVTVDGRPRFTARSPEFVFRDSTILAERSRLRIHQGNDTLTHPEVRIRYDFGKRNLTILNNRGSMRHTPYSAPYFAVDFSADILRWDLKSDSINVFTDGGRSTVPMIIESVDFYDPNDFRVLNGQGFNFHPLVLTVGYCLKNRVREFYTGDLAVYAKKDIAEIQHAIRFLAQKGMVTYDPRGDKVFVHEKAVELYRSFKGESDYDNLKIHSVIDSLPNATINIPQGYMTVRGVNEFRVSDSLNVRIKPDSSIITILQNRDIKFDGTINAGNYEISGKGFTLKYDSFFIRLTHIDSINFFVTERNSKGQNIRRKVNNSLVGADSTVASEGGLGSAAQSSGTLYISRANNKSGKQKIPTYPRLDAETGGVIYFDRPEVLGGIYDRSIFFAVPPFDLDSLNDTDPSAINFEGTFVSSGMFPSFKEKLRSMPDKSLGFEHNIPESGYQLFKGEGSMAGSVSLTNRGIRGSGSITYLAARIYSPDFLFYPDSVIATGNRAKIDAKQFGNVSFPHASLADFEMKWYPKLDQMRLKNLKSFFNMYDSTATLNGELVVSSKGVTGKGKLDTRGSELLSMDMTFTGDGFGARHAKFKVNSNDPRKPLIFGNDIRLNFNLEQNYADISPEVEGVAAINFPYAQVKTSIPNARYNLDTKKIVMSKSPNVAIENSYFYTTREELDSLAFNAESAEYDLTTQQLKVSGIPHIVVADAMITPENNEVLILENAKIGTLKNTTIVLDTLNAYHRLTNGVVDIISRKEFTGYATYQYINALQDTFAIKLTDFHLEPVEQVLASRRAKNYEPGAMQTVARGVVREEDLLVLGAGMFYKGDMTMYARRPALELDGYVKLDIKNIEGYKGWIAYSQTGDETDVTIDFDNAVNDQGEKVEAGLNFSLDNSLYITFLNNKKDLGDESLFTPSGKLFYDTESKEYKIEDAGKASGEMLAGKVFAYNDENQHIRFEGPVNLVRSNNGFSVAASVLGSGNMATNEIRMNTLLTLDSNIPSQAFDVMAREVQDVIATQGADEGLGDQTELLYKMANIVGERIARDYEQRSLQGYVPLATIQPLMKPLVISNVNLKWSEQHKAFYSEGAIGISNILNKDINGAFEGFLEIKRDEDGMETMNLFFKASGDVWYYFGFEGSRVLVQAASNEFNNIIMKRTNAGKTKIGEVAFVPGSDEETVAFINRFRRDYYGIESPYSLGSQSMVVPTSDPAAPLNQPVPTQTDQEKKDQQLEDDGF